MEFDKLISTLSERYVTIFWQGSSICNYKCSYCPKRYRNNVMHAKKNYDEVRDFIFEVQRRNPDKMIRLNVSGGEITLWKKLIPFVKEIRKKIDLKIILYTNAAPSIEWWKENEYLFDFVIASYHHHQSNKDHVIEVAKIINKKSLIFAMVTPEEFDIIHDIGKEISEKGKITVNPKLLRYDFSNVVFPYSEEQIKNAKLIGPQYFPRDKRELMNGDVLFESKGEVVDSKYPIRLIFEDKNNFKGWRCYAGTHGFWLDPNGDVFSCKDKNDNLGNLYTEVKFPEELVICKQRRCESKCFLEAATKIKE